MNLKMKTVLVTGAGGFIGSHLTEGLVDRCANVRAFVRYNSRNDWGLLELLPYERLKEIEIFMGDLKDADAIRQAIKGVDIIFHLGSLIAIPYSYTNPRETIETNMLGTLNVLTAAREEQVEKIVHTSTSEVYGTAQYVPIDERHQLQGQSPYSASKIAADKIAESFYCSYNLPVAIIRPFNTYGPRQSARAVIPAIISQAATKKIYLGSLHPTRDYTYVKDTIGAFIKIATSPESIGEVINIGSNYEISIGNLAEKIVSLIGNNAEIISDDSCRIRPERSEVNRLWCDNTKAKTLLGWSPTISLEDGLKETVDWVLDHANLYKPWLYTR